MRMTEPTSLVLSLVLAGCAQPQRTTQPEPGRSDRVPTADLVPRPESVVFVVDASGSMIEVFDDVRQTVRQSIADLKPTQSFQVLAFGAAVRVRRERPVLVSASAQNKKDAIAFLETMTPQGRTDPRPAVEAAFRIEGGPPERIEFFTDGEFDEGLVARIREWNRGKTVTINTTAFLYRGGETLLEKRAGENGGRYRFVSRNRPGGE